jgi:hypothetical protein
MTRRLSSYLTAAAIISALAAAPTHAQSASELDIPEATFQAIVKCLSAGDEIVMAPKLSCVARTTGDEIAGKANMPLGKHGWNGDWNSICQDKSDPRRLPANIIKRIAAEKDVRPAPTGIRIIGAVFCGSNGDSAALDLAGLELAYSVVIDRSVVNGFLDARNVRIKGDFSFDDTVILENLRLNRARVEGSVYGNRSFMDQLFVNDTQVTGTWWHMESIVFSDAQFVRANISGDLNMSKSAFSKLLVQSNHIGGTLNLDRSEARCAYHVNSSTVGYLAADRAGFGIVRTAEHPGNATIDYAWWNRAVSGTSKLYTQQMFESPIIKRIADAELARIGNSKPSDPKQSKSELIRGCEATSASQYLEFYVLDSTVQAAFCLTSFVWMAPKSDLPDIAHPISIVALNGTKINGNLIVDLWDDEHSSVGRLQPGHKDYKLVRKKHKFEAIGITAGALIYDFDNARPYFTYIDGLKFDRIHKAKPACTNESSTKLATHVELPSTNDVLLWLEKNAAPSSQPFMAFAAAFEQAGTSPTSLRVRQRTVELCGQTAGWFPFVAPHCPGERFSPDFFAGSEEVSNKLKQSGVLSGASEVFSGTGEILMLGFRWTLFLLADHGLRPAKVVWSVGIALLALFCWFWLILGIVGFEPKSKDNQVPAGQSPVLWPITFLFLFDRMIPAYKIREEHYAITKVYRKATEGEIKAGPRAPGEPPYPMYYLGNKYLVWPAGDTEQRKLEKWLVVARIIGLVFTIFLLAAINALTSR